MKRRVRVHSHVEGDLDQVFAYFDEVAPETAESRLAGRGFE